MSNDSNADGSSLNVQLLLDTFQQIEPQADDFADSFYNYLFIHYPHIKDLFVNTDMAGQKSKLIQSLQLVMLNIWKPDMLTEILKGLGKRHVKYGAILTDYPLVGTSLLQALKKHLGNRWTTEVETTWTLAYQTIADLMAEGAKEVPISNPIDVKPEISNPSLISDTTNESVKDSISSSPSSQNNRLSLALIFGSLAGFVILGWLLFQQTQQQPNTQPTTIENPR
jgi:hemoglobin-like flavoprotein